MDHQVASVGMMQRLLRHVISALAACMVLFGIYCKYLAFKKEFGFAAIGAILLYVLMFFLFVFRHTSTEATVKPSHCFIAVGGTLLPLLLEVEPTHVVWLQWISIPIEVVGILLSVTALYTLGRSFGIIAAKRKVKTHGVYQKIRHPLYAGESVWFLAVLLQNLSPFNLIVFAVQSACQVQRILEEETLLKSDESYALYMQQVPWRVVPGIF